MKQHMLNGIPIGLTVRHAPDAIVLTRTVLQIEHHRMLSRLASCHNAGMPDVFAGRPGDDGCRLASGGQSQTLLRVIECERPAESLGEFMYLVGIHSALIVMIVKPLPVCRITLRGDLECHMRTYTGVRTYGMADAIIYRNHGRCWPSQRAFHEASGCTFGRITPPCVEPGQIILRALAFGRRGGAASDGESIHVMPHR